MISYGPYTFEYSRGSSDPKYIHTITKNSTCDCFICEFYHVRWHTQLSISIFNKMLLNRDKFQHNDNKKVTMEDVHFYFLLHQQLNLLNSDEILNTVVEGPALIAHEQIQYSIRNYLNFFSNKVLYNNWGY